MTARVNLEIKAKDHMVKVTMYILPGAKPPCLLGLSAVRALHLMSLSPEVTLKGEGVVKGSSNRVSLIHAQRIPQQHGAVLEVQVQGNCTPGQPLLFQPLAKWREEYDLDIEDTLLAPGLDDNNCHMVELLYYRERMG